MKATIFATIAMVLVLFIVSANSIALHYSISGLIDEVEKFDIDAHDAEARAREIKTKFESTERFVSLTVNHEDLTNIEICYSDLVGYLERDMTDDAEVTKNRLIDNLLHLRRLSGINIDSII